MRTKNFTFTPQKIGGEDAPYEGHAHVFLNGKKKGRLYGAWAHLTLPKGTHRVKLNLTSNSHLDYTFREKPIAAEVEMTEDRASFTSAAATSRTCSGRTSPEASWARALSPTARPSGSRTSGTSMPTGSS